MSWLDDFLELLIPVFVILLGSLVLVALVAGLITGIDYLECRGFAAVGHETRYEWGCYAKVGDEWVPKSYVYGKANELRIKEKR